MTGPTLREIAEQMYSSLATLATQPGKCHLPLSHGLHIVLERTGAENPAWLLKLGRQKVYPSDLEIVLCKRAYRLADDHPDARLDPPETTAGWYVVAIRWHGAIPAPKRLPV